MGVKLGLSHSGRNTECVWAQGAEEDIWAWGTKWREKTTQRGVSLYVILCKYYSGEEIKNIKMNGACGMYWGKAMCIEDFDAETWGKETTKKA
jgi:hypothetical protein